MYVNESLGDFQSILNTAGQIVGKIGSVATSVGKVATSVQQTIPTAQAVAQNPTAAERGAVIAAKSANFVETHPVLSAAGGAGALWLVFKLLHRGGRR